MKKLNRLILATSLLILGTWGQVISTSQAKEGELEFNRDIRPILSDKCFACHGFDAKQRKAGLRLDTAEGAVSPGESGAVAVKAGDAEGSEVWRRITSNLASEKMPPEESQKQLTAEEKERIRLWISQGAKYQKHWSFESPVKRELPAGSPQNLVDAWIVARLKQVDLTLSGEADRETLLRRLSLDLIGIPPTPEELDAFVKDESPQAYEKQVERLLAMPQFGERMAVMWLDLSRYGDTNGYLHDIQRTGWPWRDWVIRSFNEDKPFDQFVQEQIAGDLIPDAKPEQALATAFCRNHLITTEGGTIAAEYLNEYAADRVQAFGTAFLGLSFNCCRCHDHKFDPLTQEDFYSLQAFFNSITEKHSENDSSAAYPPILEIASPLLPDGDKAKVMVMQEAPQPTPTFVLTRGEYDKVDKNRPVSRRTPMVLGPIAADAPQNRLGLAQWLIAKENPLLARVTVNRYWQRIFGTGLVKSVDDFGVQGEYPSHPELLDALAIAFRDGDGMQAKPWSTKHLLRLFVTSATYRQSSHVRPEARAKDPDNRLLAYFPRQRLSAEEIRDQALFVSGGLSGKLGGAPVYPYQPEGLWEERANEGSNTKVYKRSEGEALYRRSIYTFWKRTCPPPLMSVFDTPDRTLCTVRRVTTNTPLQALATLNEEQLLECARLLATRTLQESGDETQRLTMLFRRATGRKPSEADLKTLQAGLGLFLERYKKSPEDAATLLKQGTSPVPEQIDKAELAAWMLIANTVLNLDESLMRD